MSFDEQLRLLVDAALKEDVGEGDHSSLCCIPAGVEGKAILKIKQEGILAGMDVARKIFEWQETDVVFIPYKKDGDEMEYGEMGFEVEANVHTILKCERLVLNCMQRMSGIATLTAMYSKKLKGYKTRILDTRKTTPNFRLLEKEAVRIGGGENHRMGLYDMIMLKDNHIDYCGSLENAVDLAFQYTRDLPHLKIEVESLMEIYQGMRDSYEYPGSPRPFQLYKLPDSTKPVGRASSSPNSPSFRPLGFVWSALAKGYKFGFIASSDHISTHISYACFIAEDLSSEGLLEAIRHRRTYAATDNIILDIKYRGSDGEHLMGESFNSKTPVQISASIIGTGEILQVDLIKNNAIVQTCKPGQAEFKFHFTDKEYKKKQGENYYYVRVIQKDGLQTDSVI